MAARRRKLHLRLQQAHLPPYLLPPTSHGDNDTRSLLYHAQRIFGKLLSSIADLPWWFLTQEGKKPAFTHSGLRATGARAATTTPPRHIHNLQAASENLLHPPQTRYDMPPITEHAIQLPQRPKTTERRLPTACNVPRLCPQFT